MIIAGFTGIGKTTFANTHKNVIDLHVMPYKYSNFNEIIKKYDGESIKAASELVLNINWRYEYYDKLILLCRSEPDKIILIPSDVQIMNWLQNDDIPFILVFPAYELKEEYQNRFLERGNTKDFLDIFIANWDNWIGRLKLQKGCTKIELKANEFLSDVMNGKGVKNSD